MIRLTEQMLNRIIRNELSEITLRQASIGKTYNMLSNKDMKRGETNVTFGSKNKNTNERLGKSENIQYELLSKSLIDNCGVLTFDFVHEEEGGNNSQIIFNVSNIISLSPRKLVMTGSGMINRNKTKKIIVVYNLSTHLFYWIGYYNVAKNTMRQVLNLVLPEGNEGTYLENREAKIKLFAFINSYIEEVNKSLPQDLNLNYSF